MIASTAVHVTIQQPINWEVLLTPLVGAFVALVIACAAWVNGHAKPNRIETRQIAVDAINGQAATITQAVTQAAAASAAQVASGQAGQG